MKPGILMTRIMMFLLFLAIAAYFGSFLLQGMEHSVETAAAYTYTAERWLEASGFIIRSEQTIPAQTGMVDIVLSEGSTVAKGGVVAKVYADAYALEREADRTFFCRSGNTFYRIPLKSIRYFCSDRRRVTCVTAARTYVFYGKLDQVEQEVGAGFIRIHQRYLVRAEAVDQVEGSHVFLGDETLPVSRACREAALTALVRAALEE